MPSEVEIQAEPVAQERVMQQKSAIGASDAMNQRKMRALRAELKSRTQPNRDGRLTGPLQPATILNFNPVRLEYGGQINRKIPGCLDFPKAKTRKLFTRGGREHWAHYETFADGIYYMSPGGHDDHVELGFATPSLNARFISPMEIVWHFWRAYSTASGDADVTGGVLIIDGDIHELDDARLKKSGNEIWVPRAYVIPDTDGQMGVQLVRANLAEEVDRLIRMQVDFCGRTGQRAHELFHSKDEMERRNITAPMKIWGNFAVDMGYFKERQPWMNENPDASATGDAMKTCPVCRDTTLDPDALMCGKCKAPYNQDAAVECVKRGFPIAESFLDTLDDVHHKEVVAVLSAQAKRRAQRGAANQPAKVQGGKPDGAAE